MEYHKGKPIYYSLGNYYFGMEDCDPRWYQNLMVEIKLLRDSNEVRVSEYYGEFKVGKIVECNSLAVNHRFDTLSKQLNSEEYLPSLEAELRERWINFYRDSYAYPMRGLVGKFGIRELIKKLIDFIARREMSMTQVNMLWHNIVIESHRWAVQRILSTRLF
jgi:poly-gamma-glutamate synthesis protein (capsule biosynthesis protein)